MGLRILKTLFILLTGIGDAVCCYMCGISLRNWTPEDDPIKEHSKFNPSCSHVKFAKYNITTKVSLTLCYFSRISLHFQIMPFTPGGGHIVVGLSICLSVRTYGQFFPFFCQFLRPLYIFPLHNFVIVTTP